MRSSSSFTESDSDSDPIHTLLAHSDVKKYSLSVDALVPIASESAPSLSALLSQSRSRRLTGSLISLAREAAAADQTVCLTARPTHTSNQWPASSSSISFASSMTRSTSVDFLRLHGSPTPLETRGSARSASERNRSSLPNFVVQSISILQRHREIPGLFAGSDIDGEIAELQTSDELAQFCTERVLTNLTPVQVASVVLRYIAILDGFFSDQEAFDLFLSFSLYPSGISLLLLRSLLTNLSKTILSLLSQLVGMFRSFISESPDTLPSQKSLRSTVDEDILDIPSQLPLEQRERLAIIAFRFGDAFRLPVDEDYRSSFMGFFISSFMYARSNFQTDSDIRFKTYGKNLLISACSEELLVWTLFDCLYWDKDYIIIALILHRYFITRAMLLQSIIASYNMLAHAFANVQYNPFPERIRLIFKTWSKYLSSDIPTKDPEFVAQLTAFVAERPELSDIMHFFPWTEASSSQSSEHLLIRSASSDQRDSKLRIPKKIKIASHLVVLDIKVKKCTVDGVQVHSPLSQHKARTIAGSLTMIDNQLYRALSADEFLGKSFLKGAASAPNFLAMQRSFNRWSNWACYEIVHRPALSDRVEALTKLIYVAYICRLLNNFNTAYSIVAGLEAPPLVRLKQTWERLSKKTLIIWQDLQKLFSLDDNHQAYRTALGTAHPPIVPYLGLYSKTFLTIEDNPNDPIRTRDGLVNIAKLRNIYNLIKEIQQYQITAYNGLEPNGSILAFFENWSDRSEADLFAKSLECEPRTGTSGQTTRRLPRTTSGPMSTSAGILPRMKD